MHKHILVPVDLDNTDPSAMAFKAARAFARRDGARISAISVVPTWPEDMMVQAPPDRQPDLDAYLAEVKAQGLTGQDVDGIVKLGGSISGRIIEAVLKKEIDLVVMASHDPKITDYLIGSNAAHVVLHAPCSVMVVRKPDAVFKKLVVPVDLARPEASLKAIEVATGLARAEGGKVTVVSVQPVVIDESGRTMPDFQPLLDDFLEKHGQGAEGVLKLGNSIASEIRWAADEIDADLIVMTSHDPHFTDYVVGSNAAHVALHSHRSVLVVR